MKMRKRLIFFVLLLSFPCFFSSQHVYDVYAQEKKIRVFVSIIPQTFFVQRIGQELVEVKEMVLPGANPHTYELTPSQLQGLSAADMYVKVGTGIDFEVQWLDKMLAINKEMVVCDSSEGIELVENDPHVWLSPTNAIVMVNNIRDCLISLDPDNRAAYMRNAAGLIIDLAALKAEIENTLSGLDKRKFLIVHPAWGYFAREFSLQEVAVEHEGKEATPRQLTEIIKLAQEHRIKAVFVLPQFSRKNAEVIALEIKGKVKVLDPLAFDYIGNLRKAADALREADRQ